MRRTPILDASVASTKAAQLSVNLRRLACEAGADRKLPTVREIAAQFQASRTTVDEALNLLEAQRVVYRRQGSGIYVSPSVFRKSIAVLLDVRFFRRPRLSPFWGMLWGLCAEEAQTRTMAFAEDFEFFLTATGSLDAHLPDEVIRWAQDGLLDGVIAIGLGPTAFAWLQERRIPVVSYAGPGDWTVFDSPDLPRLGVEALSRRGCRRLGMWLTSHIEGWTQQFEDAARAQDAVCPPYFRWTAIHPESESEAAYQAGDDQDSGYRAAREIFGSTDGQRPDGIVINDDLMTDGALAAFEEMGIRVGRDIEIATLVNVGSPMLHKRSDRLIRLERDPAQLARLLFDTLRQALAGEFVEQERNTDLTVVLPKD